MQNKEKEVSSMNPQIILEEIVAQYVNLLENLVGIYLHGSLAMGCFTERVTSIYWFWLKIHLNFA